MRTPLLALAVPALCWAQAPPQMAVDALVHDFGTIDSSAPVSHRFKVTNIGGTPLEIQKLTPSCGCASSVAGRATIPPGESTEILVVFNPTAFSGPVTKDVLVSTNDPAGAEVALTFKATVKPLVVPSTDQVFFRDLTSKDRRKATVRLVSGTPQPVVVTRVDLSDAPWLGVATRPSGKDMLLDLDFLARSLPADKTSGIDSITLHLENPLASEVKVDVVWEKRLPVLATPARLSFAGAGGVERSAKVIVKHRSGQPFRILSALTTNSELTVAVLGKTAAPSQEVRVVLSPRQAVGTFDDKVILTLDLPGQPKVEVRVAVALK